jgi:hypothetical protein
MREAQADVFRPMLHRATKKGDIRNHSNLSLHVLGKKVSQNKDGILIQRGTNPSFFASEAANLASLWPDYAARLKKIRAYL